MDAYYLAVDIGASNGRHILGSVQNGRLDVYKRQPQNNRKKEKEKSMETPAYFGNFPCPANEKKPCVINDETSFRFIYTEGKPQSSDLNWIYEMCIRDRPLCQAGSENCICGVYWGRKDDHYKFDQPVL